MTISKKKNKLLISFDYSPVLVEVMRALNERQFEPGEKIWSVPIANTVEVVDKLKPMGFKCSDDVLEEYNVRKARKKIIERVKNGDFNDAEKQLLEKIELPLYNYQKIGAGFVCAAQSCLVGDQPGLGKTLQSLASVKIREAKKVLILCPSTLKDTWKEEIEKWMPKETFILIKGEKKARMKKWKEDKKFYIANYELLLKDINVINETYWDFVIADEATRISNPKSKTSKLIKKLNAKHKVPLSGTPMNNSIEDLWSIIDFCQPGLLGSYWQFTEKYCTKDRFGSISGYKNLDDLKARVKDVMIRRLKKDVLSELPDKVYETIYIEMTEKERMLYNAIKREIMDYLKDNGMKDRRGLKNVLTKMIRLRQAVDAEELITGEGGSSKLDALKELVKELTSNEEKVLIFTQFREMALILMRELKEYNPLLIAGGVDEDMRTENRKKFTESENHPVMVLTEAGAFGLNLQAATAVIHYDLPWSISKVEQREDRAHRAGQKNCVTVYTLIVKDSIDEYVKRVLFKKQQVSEKVLGDKDKVRVAKISKKDIQKLLEDDE
jgi:SNF2 family DNA or RNA helicase